MAFKSYTQCVDRDAYENPDFAVEAVIATLGALLSNPIGGTWGALNSIEKLLDYLLNKRLVCLGGDRCAVGRVVGFETAADKSFPDDADNDFSINLMLTPWSLGDFVGLSGVEGWKIAREEKMQGELIREQKPMPEPRTPVDGEHYDPYIETVDIEDAFTIGSFNTMVPLKEGITVPVLHLECEGSRISDLLHTLQDIESLGLGSAFCDIPVLGWIVCTLAKIFLSPIILIALVGAWFAATDGNPDDARTDPNAGELALGDLIVVTGRWVFDASHRGWNELHPVKSIQKVGDKTFLVPTDTAAFVQELCARTSEVPPPDRTPPGGAPTGMTPQQQGIWDAQRQPQHRWVLHPAVDGCQPRDEPQPPAIR